MWCGSVLRGMAVCCCSVVLYCGGVVGAVVCFSGVVWYHAVVLCMAVCVIEVLDIIVV